MRTSTRDSRVVGSVDDRLTDFFAHGHRIPRSRISSRTRRTGDSAADAFAASRQGPAVPVPLADVSRAVAHPHVAAAAHHRLAVAAVARPGGRGLGVRLRASGAHQSRGRWWRHAPAGGGAADRSLAQHGVRRRMAAGARFGAGRGERTGYRRSHWRGRLRRRLRSAAAHERRQVAGVGGHVHAQAIVAWHATGAGVTHGAPDAARCALCGGRDHRDFRFAAGRRSGHCGYRSAGRCKAAQHSRGCGHARQQRRAGDRSTTCSRRIALVARREGAGAIARTAGSAHGEGAPYREWSRCRHQRRVVAARWRNGGDVHAGTRP